MKRKIIILTGLFIVLVVAYTPAKLAESFIPQQRDLSVGGLSGSVWSGNIDYIRVKDISLSDIDFSVGLFSLLIASPTISLDVAGGDVQGDLDVNLTDDLQNNVDLSDANLSVSASILEKQIPVKGVELEGLISTNDLSVILENKKPKKLEGNIQWNNAALSFAGKNWKLGNFSVDTETDETTQIVTAKLNDTKNELGLKGTITIEPNGTVEIVGSIATNIDQTLYSSIALFNSGKPENGRLPIKFKQRIFR